MFTSIGIVAAILTTSSFLPQALQVVRTKQTKDISLGFTLVMTIGIFLWLVYGVLVRDIPVIAANAVSLPLSGTILVYKLRYG